jgi:hypothetical protein
MRQFLHSNQTPISGTPASQTVPDAHGLELADKVGHEAKCCPGQDRRHVRGSTSAPKKSFRQTNSRSVCRPWVSLRVDPGLSFKTGQWHWRDQLKALLPQRGFGLSFFFSFALDLHADEARACWKCFAGRHLRATASHAHRRACRRPPQGA